MSHARKWGRVFPVLATALALDVSPAPAQELESELEDEAIEEIVVTGSRI